MSFNVTEIFVQKLNEIQSRVPLPIKGISENVPFQKYLDDAAKIDEANVSAVDKEGKDRSKDVERARISRANSTAIIPIDNIKLMEMVNNCIQTASSKYGIDANLIKAIIKQESNYDPYALSKTGAQGLMQLMPDTADSLGVSDPWDIAQNIDGGTKYLRDQIINFNGDLRLSVAAYNAGPNAIRQYNGIPPYPETENYVARVMQNYSQPTR